MNTELTKLKNAIRREDIAKINIHFKNIYTQYYKLAHFLVSKYVDTLEDVNEIVEEVFLSFYEKVFDVKDVKSYLLKTAKNKAIDYLKKNKELPIEAIEELVYVKESPNSSYDHLIKRFQEVLSEEEIEIILLHVLEGMTFKEIGTKFNKKENTIRSIYNRAIKKVKRKQ